MRFKHIAILPILLFSISCATFKANTSSGLEERKIQTRVFQGSYDEIYRIVMQTAGNQNWEITHSDKDAGLVQAKTPATLSAWEDEINITMNTIKGGVQVQVKSGLANSTNAENVRKYLDSVTAQLTKE